MSDVFRQLEVVFTSAFDSSFTLFSFAVVAAIII